MAVNGEGQNHLKRLSRVGYWVTLAFMVICGIAAFAIALSVGAVPLGRHLHITITALDGTAPTRWKTLLNDVVPLAILEYALFQLLAVFRLYRKGEIFSFGASRHLRRFALALFLSSSLDLGLGVLFDVLRHRRLHGHGGAFNIDSYELMTILLSGLVWLVAAVLAEGSRIAEENDQII